MCNCKKDILDIEQTINEHSAMCHGCEIAFILKELIGVNQRLLIKFEEAYGVPKGSTLTISQLSPTPGAAYKSGLLAYDGVLRNLAVSGAGNITVSINQSNSAISTVNVGTFNVGSTGTININHHLMIPIGSSFSISTDAVMATAISLSAWIEPASMAGEEFYRVRR